MIEHIAFRIHLSRTNTLRGHSMLRFSEVCFLLAENIPKAAACDGGIPVRTRYTRCRH